MNRVLIMLIKYLDVLQRNLKRHSKEYYPIDFDRFLYPIKIYPYSL